MIQDESKKTILAIDAKYLRQKETGRVYPWAEELATRDDMDEFIHTAKGDMLVKKDSGDKNAFINE